MKSLVQNLLAAPGRIWREASAAQKAFYLLGAACLASGLFHLAVWLVVGGPLTGPVSWRKPIVFGLSGGVTVITLGWILGRLRHSRILSWVLVLLIPVPMIPEIALIAMQQWRGLPSHFNVVTPLDGTVFGLMGGLVFAIEVGIVLMALVSFRPGGRTTPSTLWAIRWAMLLLIGSQALGNLIIANGFGNTPGLTDGEMNIEAIRSASIRGEAGMMKLPHALTLHGIQVLPFLAFLLGGNRWPESRRVMTILIAGAGYSAVVGAAFWPMWRGQAPLDLDPTSAAMLGGGLLCLAATYAAALIVWDEPGPLPDRAANR